MFKTTGPFRVVRVNPHTLVIYETVIKNVVSIECVTLAQSTLIESAPSTDQMESTNKEGKNDRIDQKEQEENKTTPI